MIKIYYAYSSIVQNHNLVDFIDQLSLNTKNKLLHLKRGEDKQLLLTSMFLLKTALSQNDCNNFKLSNLLYSQTGRPFFPESPFDFNISHTENCSAVVFSKDCRVGIDIEKIKEIDFSDFTNYFTSEQWEDIFSAEDKFIRFYYYWTMIESCVKADGRGLSLISNQSIKPANGEIALDGTCWYYNHYNFDKTISCCVTTDKKNELYEIKNITSI